MTALIAICSPVLHVGNDPVLEVPIVSSNNFIYESPMLEVFALLQLAVVFFFFPTVLANRFHGSRKGSCPW